MLGILFYAQYFLNITNCKKWGKMPSTCTFNAVVSSDHLEFGGSTSALHTISEKVFTDRQ